METFFLFFLANVLGHRLTCEILPGNVCVCVCLCACVCVCTLPEKINNIIIKVFSMFITFFNLFSTLLFICF
jgi:hypothetical protein